jgi:NAD(P)-dependent dehydrogenase (short-subunit alcohol dehydrogenase family)
MKVIVIGATGILGKALVNALRKQNGMQILTASRTGNTDLTVDIAEAAQIRKMFNQAGPVDAVICTAGSCAVVPLDRLSEDDLYTGIKSKMIGQINLVLIGKDYLNEGGSFTLTSGFLSDDPMPGGINYAMANGAIDNFVLAASIELKNRIRINAVSPGWVPDQYAGVGTSHLPGQLPVSIDSVVHAYYKSAFGFLTGQVFRVWEESTQWVRK